MGSALSCGPKKEAVTNEECEDKGLTFEDKEGEIYMLVCGLDYACDYRSWAGPPPAGHGPLDTRYAFDMMVALAQSSGVTQLKTLWNQECTKEGVEAAIHEVAGQCGPNDYFIFYYTGHGDQLPQDDAENEAHDQCLCLVGPDGCTDDETMQYRQQVWWRDDDLAETICECIDTEAHVVVLADCCHSGSICDFGSDSPWERTGVKAISISGCTDEQTSAGSGKGGMFTRAMTMAIEEINSQQPDVWFSVAEVYNRTLHKYQEHKNPGHTQNISIHGMFIRPSDMCWPLNPMGTYQSPANTYLQ
eukprot:TRINITY_DN114708_c0_g1_i1.p1 TRINITY_DN114708_c0_g1~~TRINITY_DN114708_c0_g1_i1.p1  ORF type:complete len:303 (-),score=49.19 TRINITY_DN114708_c0_g1_i1:77-985(-)